MRAAYDALDDATRERIDSLAAYHSRRYSMDRADLHVSEENADRYQLYGFGIDIEPPLRPLVKIHPITGRPNLLIGQHAHSIPGLTVDESEALLDRLNDEACADSAHLLPHVDGGGRGAVGQPVPHAPGNPPRSRTAPTDVAHPDRRRPGDRSRSRTPTIRPPNLSVRGSPPQNAGSGTRAGLSNLPRGRTLPITRPPGSALSWSASLPA